MFDIGLTEMMVIGAVALIVVGPKDLPKMFHTLGQVTGKARGMAREFQRAMDSAARETGVNDIVKDFKRSTSTQGLKDATGLGDLEKDFREIGKFDGKPGAKPAATAKGKPVMPPKAAPLDDLTPEELADLEEPHFGEAALAEQDLAEQDLARRNAEMSATEAARIKRQKHAEAARLKAAELRARREAEAARQAESAEPAASAEPRKNAPQQPGTDS